MTKAEYDHKREKRLDLIFERLKENKTTDEILAELNKPKERYKKAIKRGKESEQRAFEIIESFSFVKTIHRATQRTDQMGIDGWIIFYDESGHTPKPLQVKSSQAHIDSYILSEKYYKLCKNYGGVIVVNAGPQVSENQICESFINQLEDIDGFF